MWPWEHAAIAYVLYSLSLRALGRDPPTGWATAALVFAAVLPDLIDKTLSWGLGWFPTGYAVGHSAYVAIPIGVLLLGLLHRGGYRQLSVASTLGYWSHLLGDVLNPLRYGDTIDLDRIRWPVGDQVPYETDYGIRRGLVYLEAFWRDLAGMEPASVFLLYLLVPLLTVGLWLLDGAPGLTPVRRSLSRLRTLVGGPGFDR